jgi:tRNA 5-methylaminomethyl-2-thiouridine biosynthesis bifunctional protein
MFDAEGRGAGASGNPAALVTPRLDAGLAEPAQVFAQAFRRAVALYGAEPNEAGRSLVIARGALQLATDERDAARFDKVAASGLFEPQAVERLSAGQTSARLGEDAPDGLILRDGLVIEPSRLLAAWAPEVRVAAVARIEPAGEGWRLLDETGAVLALADAVIVAAGLASLGLAPGLPLSPVRGQASFTALDDPPPAVAFGGYAIPTRRGDKGDGVLFGATNDRGDTDREVRTEDHERNLGFLAQGLPILAARLSGRRLEGRASIRVTAPDYLPVAGAAVASPPGLFVLTAFGARGFTLAPLLAEHVAASALGAPSPLPQPLAAFVDPARFARRAARRVS